VLLSASSALVLMPDDPGVIFISGAFQGFNLLKRTTSPRSGPKPGSTMTFPGTSLTEANASTPLPDTGTILDLSVNIMHLIGRSFIKRERIRKENMKATANSSLD